ncbi:MAG: amidase [Actinomycetota bacterium]|nr:amidase [Actinomycetota bacterium]
MRDAWATAEAIASGELSAVEAVGQALAVVERDDPAVNAFTLVRKADALAEAAEVDAGRRPGRLAGVPISVKDHVWMAGLPATNGSRALADHVAPRSCVCVERLIDAGAIVIGKTNNPEFCYRGSTSNELFGTTVNPRNHSRTAGGSSGGAAASVAAGMVPLAVGTDGGGSIRIPSAFCGVAGHKPTFGLVPKLPGFRGWPTLSVTGPIGVSVRDLALALDVMAGPAPDDPLSYPSPSGGYAEGVLAVDPDGLRGLRVAVSEDLGVRDIDDDVRRSFRQVIAQLADAGTAYVEAHPQAGDPIPVWEAVALPEGEASEGPVLAESPGMVGPDATALIRAGVVSAREYLDAQTRRGEFAAVWLEFLTSYDVLLAPTMPVTAFSADRLGPKTIGGRRVPDGFDAWCGALALPANLAGLPALTLPIAPGRDGLPVGLQVIGPRWADRRVLQVGAAIEALIG